MKKIVIGIMLFMFAIIYIPKTYAITEIDYEDLFNNHQTVMLIIHPITGEIFYANQAAADFYGYTIVQLLDMNINQINTLSPDEIAIERLKALEEERNFFIFKHRLANNEIRTVYVYSYPVIINEETYLYSIIIDQTDYVMTQNKNRNLLAGIFSLMSLTIIMTILLVFILRKKNTSLKESEQRFEILHNASFGGIAVHDKGLILDCNQGLSDITQYSMKELIGMNGLMLIAPEYRDFIMEKILSGYEKPYEAMGIRKNGEVFPIRIEARNIPYQGKQVRVTEFRDLTFIKQQEQAKKESEEQYSLLTTEMPLGLNLREIIYDLEGKPVDYRFLSVNRSYEMMTGLKKEDIIGKTALEVLPNIEKYWIEKYGKVVSTGESIQFEDYSQAIGKYFKVTAYSPQKGQFAVIVDDISDHKQLEFEITKEKETLKATLNSIGDAVIATDANGLITGMNPIASKLTGWSEAEALKKPFQEVFHIISEDENSIIENPIERVLSTNSVVELKNHTILISKDQTQYFIEDTASPIKNDKDEIMGVVLVFRDVTEKKQKEMEIIHISKHDFLTGLPNRRYFDEKLKELDQEANYPLLISMIDLNGLKLINDAFGHAKGNDALIKVAEILQKTICKTGFVARIGGDEFIMLCPNSNESKVDQIKQKLFEEVNQSQFKDFKFSLSYGYSIKKDRSKKTDDMLKEAEDNMYSNKVLHGQSARNESVMSVLETLKDKYEEERIHSDKVSQYCKSMGEKLMLDEDAIKELELAGLMHDIGKITIPDSILDKPGKLTDEEWKIMKSHTIGGYNILRSADKYSRLAEYALTHHERWDGKGYPNGLKGEEIPLFSRIIGVSDAYEAMTSDRPYRKALSQQTAIDELYRCAGTQFDAKLVDIFVKEVI